MDSGEFKKQSLYNRYTLLKDKGTYMTSRYSGTYQVHLYGIFGFYVEVWCQVGYAQVTWIEVVNSPNKLEPYLELIDLKID